MATVLQKMRRVVDSGSEPILYFEDVQQLRQWEREFSAPLVYANEALYEFTKFYGIENIDEFFAMLENPTQAYISKHKAAHREEFARFEQVGVELTVKIPEGFDKVLKVAEKAKNRFNNKKPAYYSIQDGQVILSDEYYKRRDAKCKLYATTPEEKERLQFANDLIKFIEDRVVPMLKDDKKMAEAIKTKKYFLPLPYYLKMVQTDSGVEVIANPNWVKNKFKGTTHLGRYIPSPEEEQQIRHAAMPRLGEQYVKFIRPMMGGTEREFICQVDLYEQHKHPNDRVIPGTFNERGKPWGEPLDNKPRAMRETIWTPLN